MEEPERKPAPGTQPQILRMATTNNNARKPASNKPRASRVRVTQADPATLESVNLSAPILALPPHLAAALQTAQADADARRQRATKAPAMRVSLTAAQMAALAAAGWKAPRADANLTVTPEPRKRQNACKGDVAYVVACAALQAGPLHVADLAALWVTAGNQPRPLNGVAQQLANRAGRKVQQDGALLMLA
jgi:hypothetical protein